MKAKPSRRVLRHLKVSSQYAPRANGRHVRVPWIRLQGRWLETAGFVIGAAVHVRVSRGRLVLSVRETTATS